MKKISVVILLCAMGLVSCGNSYSPSKRVRLKTDVDSVNYALGVLNGTQIKQYQMANDEKYEMVPEFIDALRGAYKETLSMVEQSGKNFGSTIRNSEKVGLMNNEHWTLKEPLFFQGLVNGFYEDSTVMSLGKCREIVMLLQYTEPLTKYEPDDVAGATVLGDCPIAKGVVSLENYNDTLNYAYGVQQGSDLKTFFSKDSTITDLDAALKTFVDALNKNKKANYKYPQLVTIGEQIGTSIRMQEPQGLFGIKGLDTKFDLIVKGFINGIHNEFTTFDMSAAEQCINTVFPRYQYATNRLAGEAFLDSIAKQDSILKTESGLLYKKLIEGTGDVPTEQDTVTVHYTGRLIDGTIFDSSVERGEPLVSPANGLIPGWIEGLQLMSVGSKFMFYIPYDLGYGSRPAGDKIKPFSALVFEVELLNVKRYVVPTVPTVVDSTTKN